MTKVKATAGRSPKKKESEIIAGAREALEFLSGTDNGSRVTTVKIEAGEIREIRRTLRLSQAEFSRQFGFQLSTVRNWEQGRNKPDGPARVLLAVIRRDPGVARAAARDLR